MNLCVLTLPFSTFSHFLRLHTTPFGNLDGFPVDHGPPRSFNGPKNTLGGLGAAPAGAGFARSPGNADKTVPEATFPLQAPQLAPQQGALQLPELFAAPAFPFPAPEPPHMTRAALTQQNRSQGLTPTPLRGHIPPGWMLTKQEGERAFASLAFNDLLSTC